MITAMDRKRYVIAEQSKPHFLTYTVMVWLIVFTSPETVQVLLGIWLYLREHDDFRLYRPCGAGKSPTLA